MRYSKKLGYRLHLLSLCYNKYLINNVSETKFLIRHYKKMFAKYNLAISCVNIRICLLQKPNFTKKFQKQNASNCIIIDYESIVCQINFMIIWNWFDYSICQTTIFGKVCQIIVTKFGLNFWYDKLKIIYSKIQILNWWCNA